jgi:hypothetical protein
MSAVFDDLQLLFYVGVSFNNHVFMYEFLRSNDQGGGGGWTNSECDFMLGAHLSGVALAVDYNGRKVCG